VTVPQVSLSRLPVLAAVGIDAGKPEIVQVHNIIRG
jgi:hypothetical protein